MASTSSTSSATTGYQLTSINSSSQLQLTGLASGLNTDSIVQALVETQQQQITNVTNEQTGVNSQTSELTNIQTDLQTVANDATALMDPSLYHKTQAVSSTNSSIVSAALTSAGGNAVQGAFEIGVTQLATAAQKTFTFTPPSDSGGDDFTINGKSISVSNGETLSSFVNAINQDSSLGLSATLMSANNDGSGTIVLSNSSTGQQPADPNSYITVDDAGGTLTQTTAQENADSPGQDALYTLNGDTTDPPISSSSNTLTTAIPGVTVTLNGVTANSGPVTIDVGAPAPNAANIQSALQTFIGAYNSVIGEMQTQLAQQPSSSTPAEGSLYNDPGLSGLLASMRAAMSAQSYGPSGTGQLNSMINLGVSTGATTGGGAPSQSSIDGYLTLDASALQSWVQGSGGGVQSVLLSFAMGFTSLVNQEAGPGGVFSSRISENGSQASYLANQIDNDELRPEPQGDAARAELRANGGGVVAEPVAGQLADLASQLAAGLLAVPTPSGPLKNS